VPEQGRSAIVAVGEGLYELGLDEATGDLSEGFGGDAANTAVMAATMGAQARIVGRVGDDALGRRLVAFWQERGVLTHQVTLDPSRPTGIYVNRRGVDGARRFDYHRTGSAGSAIAVSDVERVPLDDVAAVHFTGIGLASSATSLAACTALARRARAAGALVSFAVNLRPALSPSLDALREAAASSNLVFASTEEAALLYETVEAAVETLAPRAKELVVTDGERGATVYAEGAAVHHSPPSVDVVDAAGAGDALAGAYIAARVRGDPVETALLEGVVAGAFSCQSFGCAASYPSNADVRAGCATTGGRTR
jgi:2-dehydro-3-deoxygluconokinase